MSELTETDRKFIQGMRDAVAERGEDFVYPTPDEDPAWYDGGACVYALEDGTPACIVGLAIAKSGIGQVPERGAASEASIVLVRMGVSTEVRDSADRAQSAQDQGDPWGEVLARFIRELGYKGVTL